MPGPTLVGEADCSCGLRMTPTTQVTGRRLRGGRRLTLPMDKGDSCPMYNKDSHAASYSSGGARFWLLLRGGSRSFVLQLERTGTERRTFKVSSQDQRRAMASHRGAVPSSPAIQRGRSQHPGHPSAYSNTAWLAT